MPREAAQKVEALAAQAQRLMGTFARAGYEQIVPAIIQPAGLFLDVVGEALRARTYVFTDPDGEELCLRPDLTVPTCRLHLARHPAGDTPGALLLQRRRLPLSAGRRHQRASERVPPGRHRVVRRADREQDDAAVLALIVEALQRGRSGAVPAELRRSRPVHGAARRAAHAAALAPAAAASFLASRGLPRRAGAPHLARGAAGARGPARADGRSRSRAAAGGARAWSRPTWSGPALELIGTRTLPEIAERLLAEAADARETPLAPDTAGAHRELHGAQGPGARGGRQSSRR